MKTCEELIDDLGGFSRFQYLIVFGVFSMKFVAGFSMLQMSFMGYVPDYYCVTENNSSAQSSQGKDYSPAFSPLVHVITSSDYDNATLNKCDINNTDCASYVYDDPAHTVISEWNLVCDLLWVKATTTSVQMAGVLVGALISGQLGDLIGRKKTLYSLFLFHALFNLGAAFATSWPMYMVLRFFIGIGIGAILVLIVPYPIEFLPLHWRATLPLLPMFSFGAGSLGLAAWLLKDWSQLHIVCAVMSIPNLLGWFVIPESFRWLAVKGRVKEAYKVVETIGRMNKRPVPPYALDIINNIAKEAKSVGEGGKKYSYIDLFRGRLMIRCTIAFAFMWCFLSIAFYGPSFAVASFGGNIYLNIILINVLDVPFLIITFFINKRVGRRLAQSGLLSLSLLACFGCLVIIWTGDTSETGKTVSTYLSLTAKVIIASAWSVSQAWVTEVYPTVTRNLGYGMANTAARVGGILAPFAINLDEYATLSYILTCGVTLLCLLLTFVVPETKDVVLADNLTVEHKPPPAVTGQTKNQSETDFTHSNREVKSVVDSEENAPTSERTPLLLSDQSRP